MKILNGSQIEEDKGILETSVIDEKAKSFHITDLLEKTFKDERNPNSKLNKLFNFKIILESK